MVNTLHAILLDNCFQIIFFSTEQILSLFSFVHFKHLFHKHVALFFFNIRL